MDDNFIKYIISRLINNAFDAKNERIDNKDSDLAAGRQLAYFEMLDMLKSEFDANGYDLEEFGLEDIDKKLME